MPTLSIVIPSFNEEKRLPETIKSLKVFVESSECPFEVEAIIIVDDGSSDHTLQVAQGLKAEWPIIKIEEHKINLGKGAAVHKGMQSAVGEWILIADADMATPWDQLLKLQKHIKNAQVVIGSRRVKESEIIRRQSLVRLSMGRIFNLLVKILLPLKFEDTQCGFKLIQNDFFFRNQILSELKVAGFAWDVEMLLWVKLKDKVTVEVPIRWQHQTLSRVRLYSDSLDMVISLIELRSRYLRSKR